MLCTRACVGGSPRTCRGTKMTNAEIVALIFSILAVITAPRHSNMGMSLVRSMVRLVNKLKAPPAVPCTPWVTLGGAVILIPLFQISVVLLDCLLMSVLM